MSLLDQSSWWLIPYILLVLVMLQAMMEFTISLLVQRPPANRRPLPAEELKLRLLAGSQEAQSYQLVKGKDCDLEIVWEQVGEPNAGRSLYAKSASRSHIRFLFDDARHELRVNQVSHSFFFLAGMSGWMPRLQAAASATSGPPEAALTKQVSQVANRCGWTVRPVIWWFQATRRGFHFLESLTPKPLRNWSARRVWGILYPLSFVLMIACLNAISGGFAPQDLWLILLVSAGWWGAWGFLVWMLLGFPAFWRGRGQN